MVAPEERMEEPEPITREMILKIFIAESEDYLKQMEEALLGLELRPGDQKLIQAFFRSAHSLKGNASSMGFVGLADLAHSIEDVFQGIRNGNRLIDTELISLLLRALDLLAQMVKNSLEGIEAAPPEYAEMLKKLGAAASGGDAVESVRETNPQPSGPPPERRAEGPIPPTSRGRTLRVDVNKLDRMMNLSGEIAIARGRFRQMIENGLTGGDPLEVYHSADLLFMELQELITQIRMVPIGPLFRQNGRYVRDLALAHQKQARLVMQGEDVEVDTTVIEHLRDPILHMIRNAIDHGIESPDKRREAGKDPCGLIVLKARHEAGNIVVQVEDDGAGPNRQAILGKAIAKGMASESQALADDEIFRFVFEPGFSTSETVSETSGRGVGMDIVRKNIDLLRGSVEMRPREGCGTRITIRLPLTLAIIRGFSVGVGDETYVILLETVAECLDLPVEDRHPNRREGIINLHGEPIPYLRLRHYFNLGGEPPRRESVVVVSHRGGKMGLVVDSFYGEGQAVIKPMGKLFQNFPGLAGSTILGNGRVALILDLPTLFEAVVARPSAIAGPVPG